MSSDELWQMKPYKNMEFENGQTFDVEASIDRTWAAVTNMLVISGHATGTWVIGELPEDPKPGRMMYGSLITGRKVAGLIVEFEPLRKFVFDRAKRRFEFNFEFKTADQCEVDFKVYSIKNPNIFPWSRKMWKLRPPENVSSISHAIKYDAENSGA